MGSWWGRRIRGTGEGQPGEPLLDRAERIIVPQEAALGTLTPAQAARVGDPPSFPPRRGGARHPGPRTLLTFVANVRAVEDPLLPESSRVRVVHVGAGLDEALTERVRSESASNPRYEWRGSEPRAEALGQGAPLLAPGFRGPPAPGRRPPGPLRAG